VNNDAAKFVEAVKQHDADILGMSALLTTTMPYMKVVIQALKDEGLRDKVFVMVGGAPVSEAFAEDVQSDAYGRDAATAVDIAKKYMKWKQEGKK
jgi:5-methyltetrahydrofolate--homocysteine methyltransferase